MRSEYPHLSFTSPQVCVRDTCCPDSCVHVFDVESLLFLLFSVLCVRFAMWNELIMCCASPLMFAPFSLSLSLSSSSHLLVGGVGFLVLVLFHISCHSYSLFLLCSTCRSFSASLLCRLCLPPRYEGPFACFFHFYSLLLVPIPFFFFFCHALISSSFVVCMSCTPSCVCYRDVMLLLSILVLLLL